MFMFTINPILGGWLKRIFCVANLNFFASVSVSIVLDILNQVLALYNQEGK